MSGDGQSTGLPSLSNMNTNEASVVPAAGSACRPTVTVWLVGYPAMVTAHSMASVAPKSAGTSMPSGIPDSDWHSVRLITMPDSSVDWMRRL